MDKPFPFLILDDVGKSKVSALKINVKIYSTDGLEVDGE